MGVPGFNTFMRQKACPDAFKKRRKPFDHVYVDLASILHAAVRRGESVRKHHECLMTTFHVKYACFAGVIIVVFLVAKAGHYESIAILISECKILCMAIICVQSMLQARLWQNSSILTLSVRM